MKNPMNLLPAILLAILLALPATGARAQGPTEELKGAVERTLTILARTDLGGEDVLAERRILLRREIRPLFDFPEMARRALGPHWEERSDEEREEFTELFTRILEDSYLGKIESYKGKIRYMEETLKPPYAEVKTVVDSAGGEEVSADYRMRNRGDRWQIYDVLIDGVSVVSNCRSQFGSMLRYYSFEKLIEKLKSMPACRG